MRSHTSGREYDGKIGIFDTWQAYALQQVGIWKMS